MHPEIEMLTGHLRKATAMLEHHGIKHWASWLRHDEVRIRELDFYGIEHLLLAFGGMGSLNDVSLAKSDSSRPGCYLTSPEETECHEILAEIHRLATKLQSEER